MVEHLLGMEVIVVRFYVRAPKFCLGRIMDNTLVYEAGN